MLHSLGGEGGVDVVAEGGVVKHVFWVVSLVLLEEAVVLGYSDVEAELGKDGLELSLGDLALPEFVEVLEEFFHSNSLHNDQVLESLFNIAGVIGNFYSLLQVPVGDDIESGSGVREEGLGLLHFLVGKAWLLEGVLGDVGGEHVLGPINVLAEIVVVDLPGVSLVTVLPNHEVEHHFGVGHQVQVLHDSEELGGSDVTALGPVVVLELGFE